ncbi:DNA repair protein SbcD/Mre11 [Enterococcus sp. AZ194]|uniref:metallophosphoesterase family protein n=1 Tax=Enterococcus sp. AZ194 TaxID=2774629 RepID=UPI003F1EEE47
MVKFIHAADLHLDRSFEGLVGMAREAQLDFLEVNQKVLENIVDAAISQEVDCLLLAGDTFHQSRPSLRTQKHFFEQMSRLSDRQVPVFLIFGNHDYYQSERYWFEFPENVYLYTSEKVETKQWKTRQGESVAISGFSYTNQWLKTAKVSEFPSRYPVDIHLGIYHGELGKTNNYAPFQVTEMQQKGYDYWALGHIHVPSELSRQPGIFYPGTPQGHTQKEEQVEGVLLVEIKEGEVDKQFLPVAEIHWVTKELSLETVRTSQEALKKIEQSLYQIQSSSALVKRTLIQLKLTDFEQLGKEFQESVENREIVHYLLEKAQQETLDSYIWAIEFVHQSTQSKIKIEASMELAQQLFHSYQDKEEFQQILSEIYGHPIAHRLLADTPEFQETVLKETQRLFDSDFTIGGTQE